MISEQLPIRRASAARAGGTSARRRRHARHMWPDARRLRCRAIAAASIGRMRRRRIGAARPLGRRARRAGAMRRGGRGRRRRPARSPSLVVGEQRCAAVEDLVEHGLRVGHRAADDLQHLGGRGLLLERLLGLVEQARVLDGDHRLVGEVCEQLDLGRRRSVPRASRCTSAIDADRARRRAAAGTIRRRCESRCAAGELAHAGYSLVRASAIGRARWPMRVPIDARTAAIGRLRAIEQRVGAFGVDRGDSARASRRLAVEQRQTRAPNRPPISALALSAMRIEHRLHVRSASSPMTRSDFGGRRLPLERLPASRRTGARSAAPPSPGATGRPGTRARAARTARRRCATRPSRRAPRAGEQRHDHQALVARASVPAICTRARIGRGVVDELGLAALQHAADDADAGLDRRRP